jgi:hypothetical protein
MTTSIIECTKEKVSPTERGMRVLKINKRSLRVCPTLFPEVKDANEVNATLRVCVCVCVCVWKAPTSMVDLFSFVLFSNETDCS